MRWSSDGDLCPIANNDWCEHRFRSHRCAAYKRRRRRTVVVHLFRALFSGPSFLVNKAPASFVGRCDAQNVSIQTLTLAAHFGVVCGVVDDVFTMNWFDHPHKAWSRNIKSTPKPFTSFDFVYFYLGIHFIPLGPLYHFHISFCHLACRARAARLSLRLQRIHFVQSPNRKWGTHNRTHLIGEREVNLYNGRPFNWILTKCTGIDFRRERRPLLSAFAQRQARDGVNARSEA